VSVGFVGFVGLECLRCICTRFHLPDRSGTKTIAAVPTSKVLMGVQGQDWEVFAVEPGICG